MSSGDININTPARKELFQYYNKLYDDNGTFLEKAQCSFCDKALTYHDRDNDGSLWRHLKQIHHVRRGNVDPLSTGPPTHTPKTTKKNPIPDAPVVTVLDHKQNPIYRYFTVYTNNKAKCRVCMSASLPTPLLLAHGTAMKYHLQKHPRAYKLYELERDYGEAGPEFNEKVHQPKTSKVVTLDDDGTYKCKICNTIKSGGTSEAINHFREKHASLAGEVAGTDQVVSEVVRVGAKKKKVPILIHKNKINDTIPVSAGGKQKSLHELSLKDDLDTFSLYVASLLRNLPKDDCIQVQQTIMNNIFQARLNSKSDNEKSTKQKSIQDKEDSNEEETKVQYIYQAKLDSKGVKSSKKVTIQANKMERNAEEDLTDIENESNENVTDESPASKRYKYAISEDANILELA
ncbi:hypothetical protein NE865_03966 [Phthorimaea operculella]|nr:hypothetical protein NE865_03966 [Phthorimaea operculella]